MTIKLPAFAAAALLAVFLHSGHRPLPPDGIDKVVDLAIQLRDGNPIELPNLYDSLATKLPDPKSDATIMGERLKRRGYVQVDHGWGSNYAPRIERKVMVTYRKNDCDCTVSKIYYYTTLRNTYEIAERISCNSNVPKKK